MTGHHNTDRDLTDRDVELLTTLSEPYLSCSDCFEQVDACVDDLTDGGDTIDEPLRIHLQSCVVCLDEAETLLELATEDKGLVETEVLERFRTIVNTPATPGVG